MTNKEIYKKTLVFSVKRLLVDFIGLLLLVGMCFLGFLILDKSVDQGLIGLVIGLIAGIIIMAIISHFVSYALKAGQIAMMTKGITEGTLPDNVYAEGKAIVKKRFSTVAAFYAVTNVIKGIFNQLGKGITAVGEMVGGDAGSTVGSAISSVIQVVVAYLCDCCLGWVFYREGTSAAKATCEGAVLFFKHGKTLAKNMGRIFGMGIVSLLVISAGFTGIFYLIFMLMPGAFSALSNEIVQISKDMDSTPPDFLTNPTTLMIVAAAVLGVILWTIIHSTFIRPFVLTGVLRNFIESGKNDIPSESSFSMLDKKSSKFAKLHSELGKT